jgi:hypothetical protein
LPSEDGVGGVGWQMMQEVTRVQRAFAAANPGYKLGFSPPRDFERQVTLWTTNLELVSTATHLYHSGVKQVAKPEYDLPASLARVADFARWLWRAPVTKEPGNAAPGTSDHGMWRAVDFVVMQGGRVVAGTNRKTIPAEWTAPGWATRLATATSGSRLSGPLATPYEPWHWILP